VVVTILRGFGRKILTRYAFGQKLLTCSAHQSRSPDFSRQRRTRELTSSDHELTRIREICTVCPQG
jgi:hypothetical protein